MAHSIWENVYVLFVDFDKFNTGLHIIIQLSQSRLALFIKCIINA
jgi:hypothetical protein